MAKNTLDVVQERAMEDEGCCGTGAPFQQQLHVDRKYFKLFHLNCFHRTKAPKAKARRLGAQLKKHKGSKSDAQWCP